MKMREEQEEVKDDKLRTRSFRCSDEVFSAIKEICSENGFNQQEAMTHLLEAWNFVQASQAPSLISQQDRIKKFTEHMNVLEDMFVGVLSDMATLDDTISTNYRAVLESKEARLNAVEAERNRVKTELSEAETKYAKLKEDTVNRISDLEKYSAALASDLQTEAENRKKESALYQSQFTDKDRIIVSLEEKLKAAEDAVKEKAAEITSLREEAAKTAGLVKALETAKAELTASNASRAAALESLRKENSAKEESLRAAHAAEIRRLTAEAEFEQKKAVFEAEAAARQELETKHREELMVVQKRYADMFTELAGGRNEAKNG